MARGSRAATHDPIPVCPLRCIAVDPQLRLGGGGSGARLSPNCQNILEFNVGTLASWLRTLSGVRVRSGCRGAACAATKSSRKPWWETAWHGSSSEGGPWQGITDSGSRAGVRGRRRAGRGVADNQIRIWPPFSLKKWEDGSRSDLRCWPRPDPVAAWAVGVSAGKSRWPLSGL